MQEINVEMRGDQLPESIDFGDPLTLDMMLNELEAMIHVLGDIREDHLGHGERMTAEQTDCANTALWGAELGLTHLHEHYRSLVDKCFRERR